MGRPSLEYNARSNRWEVRGKGGTLRFAVDDASNPLGRVIAGVGSNAAIAAVGSYSTAIGSIQLVGVAAGDAIIATPKVAMPTNLSVGGFFVSGANNINFSVINPDIDTVGSMPAMGWDIIAIRRA